MCYAVCIATVGSTCREGDAIRERSHGQSVRGRAAWPRHLAVRAASRRRPCLGGPVLLAVFAGFGLGDYVHPRLANLFANHGWPLLAVMLTLACLGIALVARLMRRATRVRLIWLLVPAGIVLVAVAPFVAAGRSFPVFYALSLAMMVIPLVVMCLGAAVTTVTLWRHSRWLAITWLCCWLGGVTFLVYATSETADSGSPGDGFVVLPVVAALVVVVLVAATLASLLCGVSDWTDHARRIEQGV